MKINYKVTNLNTGEEDICQVCSKLETGYQAIFKSHVRGFWATGILTDTKEKERSTIVVTDENKYKIEPYEQV